YVQFHPTSLYIPNEARFLLTEALRGEGAILRDASGRAFAKDFHADGELAPRDIVARGVFEEGQKGDGSQHNVYLDITHRDGDWLHGRFPSIQEHLSRKKLDLAKDLLPVTPAAHYTCGGIATDMQEERHCQDCMQPVRRLGLDFMEETAWLRLRFWKDWCLRASSPTTLKREGKSLRGTGEKLEAFVQNNPPIQSVSLEPDSH
ncbi:L-aspartate oxidase (Partial), partial [Seminavis robusta]